MKSEDLRRSLAGWNAPWLCVTAASLACAGACATHPEAPLAPSKAGPSPDELALAKGDALFAKRQEGLTPVREAIEAYSVVREGALREEALSRTARAWHFLGTFGHLKGREREEAFDAGERAARDALSPPTSGSDKGHVEARAWLAANLADRPGPLGARADEWKPIADGLCAESEIAGFAVCHRLLGRFYASKAGLAGGDLQKSRQHFERALALKSSPLTELEMARTWAVAMQDVPRFRSLLTRVVQAEDAEFRPEATALHDEAARLLRREQELFGDPAANLP